jgi:hypothetical protein
MEWLAVLAVGCELVFDHSLLSGELDTGKLQLRAAP